MTRQCPICNKPLQTQNYLPFCSERCKLIDLGAWVSERYRLPAERADFTESAPGANDTEGESE
jgi:endogenous inhibitor of DNA gyrase (YacG/DUF329 family)